MDKDDQILSRGSLGGVKNQTPSRKSFGGLGG